MKKRRIVLRNLNNIIYFSRANPSLIKFYKSIGNKIYFYSNYSNTWVFSGNYKNKKSLLDDGWVKVNKKDIPQKYLNNR